jgi:XTP/dITP diphosphohydrolase
MKSLIVASKNKGKLNEINQILTGIGFSVKGMDEVGIYEEIEESGNTFEENAILKAKAVYKLKRRPVIADDSGLEVDYLNGAPGIYSARFAGENASDEDKNKKLLSMLEGISEKKRTARFVCVIAVVFSEDDYFVVRGTCDGFIGLEPIGDNGFGYDPLFYVPEYEMTTAQMPSHQKNEISHRGKALKAMVEELKKRNI